MKFLEKLLPEKSSSQVGFLAVWEILAIAVVSLLLTAIEIQLSQQAGILGNPIPYDGVAYVLEAKQLYYRFGRGWFRTPSPLIDLFGNRYPVWTALMMLSQILFGEGEWQCYSVHFWSTFLLLLLMLWVVRSRSNGYLAWTIVIITGLLPIASTSLRAATLYYFKPPQGTIRYGITNLEWYAADLRPNILCFVLLLWAIVLLVERVRSLNRSILLIAGTFTALAVLTKATYLPIVVMMIGLTLVYVGWVNRKRLRSTVLTCGWGLLSFLVLTVPWMMIGGFGTTIGYIYWNAIVNGSVWATTNPTFLTETTHYWKKFPFFMGPEGWFVLTAGLLSFAVVWVKSKRVDDRLLAYLGLAIVYYAFVAANQVKDHFSGNLYYLLLWLFCWLAMLPILLWATQRFRPLPLLLAGLYLVITLSRGLYVSLNWPPQYQVGQQNHAVIQQMGEDLFALLTPDDCFVPADTSNVSNIQYYAVGKRRQNRGRVPNMVAWPLNPTPPSQAEVNKFIQASVSQCKAIFTYEIPLEEAARYFAIQPQVMPFYQAVNQWVKGDRSGYQAGPLYSFRFNYCKDRSCKSEEIPVRLYRKAPKSNPKAGEMEEVRNKG
ncbi:hypothetical protein K9N68_20635 [Kovacikia minuta CCNUW1]|uniref:hypothetical protein n=1 Tax=Kovacikia minuta TaxID=2931930 RepID=UPI001CCA99F3|nr:hypothetical protein [Kovacikia minuta]UBF24121.1 hypothetical protein K9N68_20635 [Kovacikia minuta CCNUW1]